MKGPVLDLESILCREGLEVSASCMDSAELDLCLELAEVPVFGCHAP